MAPRKKKEEPLMVSHLPDKIEFHVRGDMLHDAVFNSIIQTMKENRESENPKTVVFVVYSAMMMTLIKYAIPSQYYSEVVMHTSSTPEMEKEMMKDAVGM